MAIDKCTDDWEYDIPEPLWLELGQGWTNARSRRLEDAMALVIRWLESLVQQLDVVENGGAQSWGLYWAVLPTTQVALEEYFGVLSEERFVTIRNHAHRMLLTMTAQSPYNMLRVEAGDNDVGTCADGFSAWSWTSEIGFCLDTLDLQVV